MARFQDEWLLDPNLKDWVGRVKNSTGNAWCRCCGIFLRAHKSDLTGHADTQKHARKVMECAESGKIGPMSVEMHLRDHNPEANVLTPRKEANDSIRHGSSSSAGKPRCTKRYYRKEWEDIDAFKAWLMPFKPDCSKAYCKFCNCALRAHHNDLILHAKSSRHKQVEFEFSRTNNLNSKTDMGRADDLSELETSSKRARLDDIGKIEIGADDGEQFSQVSSLVEEDGGRLDLNVFNAVKLAGGYSYLQNAGGSENLPIPARRPKLKASKVIQAIQSNEFTGYELLQIVKCAVPKL